MRREAQCKCPDGYEVNKATYPESCKVKDMCKDSPCGDTRAAKSCHQEGINRYSCQCNLGYISVEINNKITCDDIFNHLVCSSHPCGVDGVENCEDGKPGVKCTCLHGYTLKKETLQYRCSREDPCRSNPCGRMDIVSSCVATPTAYMCTCKDGYMVAVNEHGRQYCVTKEEGSQMLLYAGAGGGALLLLFFVVACTRKRHDPDVNAEEEAFLMTAEGGGMNNFSDTAVFNPAAGWR